MHRTPMLKLINNLPHIGNQSYFRFVPLYPPSSNLPDPRWDRCPPGWAATGTSSGPGRVSSWSWGSRCRQRSAWSTGPFCPGSDTATRRNRNRRNRTLHRRHRRDTARSGWPWPSSGLCFGVPAFQVGLGDFQNRRRRSSRFRTFWPGFVNCVFGVCGTVFPHVCRTNPTRLSSLQRGTLLTPIISTFRPKKKKTLKKSERWRNLRIFNLLAWKLQNKTVSQLSKCCGFRLVPTNGVWFDVEIVHRKDVIHTKKTVDDLNTV